MEDFKIGDVFVTTTSDQAKQSVIMNLEMAVRLLKQDVGVVDGGIFVVREEEGTFSIVSDLRIKIK